MWYNNKKGIKMTDYKNIKFQKRKAKKQLFKDVAVVTGFFVIFLIVLYMTIIVTFCL